MRIVCNIGSRSCRCRYLRAAIWCREPPGESIPVANRRRQIPHLYTFLDSTRSAASPSIRIECYSTLSQRGDIRPLCIISNIISDSYLLTRFNGRSIPNRIAIATTSPKPVIEDIPFTRRRRCSNFCAIIHLSAPAASTSVWIKSHRVLVRRPLRNKCSIYCRHRRWYRWSPPYKCVPCARHRRRDKLRTVILRHRLAPTTAVRVESRRVLVDRPLSRIH